MKKLNLLILCLLVACKSFSQNVIQKDSSVVILSEYQAKEVIKELIKYDYLKKISVLQQTKINEYVNKEKLYEEKISYKDLLILEQSKHIDKQDKIIKKYSSLQLHGYISLQSKELTLQAPIIRTNVMLEYNKMSGGAIYTQEINKLSNWGVIIQYKIF